METMQARRVALRGMSRLLATCAAWLLLALAAGAARAAPGGVV
jgi:hypothetical protein